MKTNVKNVVLVVVLVAVAGAIAFLESRKADVSFFDAKNATIAVETTTMDAAEKAKKYERAKELVSIAGYINADEGFTLSEHVGKKVILLDFWTYSCINCQRTLPFLTNWYEKYKDQGLLIVGIHTPEFKFEQEYDNVVRATEEGGIAYPVVQDNAYGTWRAYGNRYWPRKYLIDIDGFVVYDHIGEGAYEETERKIQELLEERRVALGEEIDIARTIERPADVEDVDFSQPRSPETYFGSARNNRLGNGRQGASGVQEFVETEGLKTHILYFDGTWYFDPEFAENRNAGARIIYRYQAEKVFIVARSDEGVRATILIDDKPVGERAGAHVDENGQVLFKEDKLYRLVEDPNGWGEHTIEIIMEESGVEVYAFTFG